ncbi:MAG: efflux RND transporter periplasmic adaptor subunit [Terracidiphilus sp.]
MRKQIIPLFSSGLALAATLSLAACHAGSSTSEASAAVVPTAQVAEAAAGTIEHSLSLAGQFQPYQIVDVHPKVTGFMVKINVDIGDKVHQGQVLAVLEVPELNAQLQGTQFAMQQAKDDLIRARHEVKQAEAMHAALHADYQRLLDTSKVQPGLIAQQELDDAQGKDLSAEARVDAAQAAVAAAQQHVQVAQSDNQRVQAISNYTNVIAPIDGVIVWRYADTGALIQSGTNSNAQDIPIVRLAQSGLLRLRMPVPENDVQYVHVGDPIQVRVDAIHRSFTGKIVRFTRQVNFETRTMETEVDVENKDLSITPGMYANASLPLAQASNVVTIPVEALMLHGNQDEVLVLDANSHVRVRKVQVGLRGSKLAEIKSGLQTGERVVVGGQEKYTDGEEISPILISTPTSDVARENGGVIDMTAEQNASGGGNQ